MDCFALVLKVKFLDSRENPYAQRAVQFFGNRVLLECCRLVLTRFFRIPGATIVATESIKRICCRRCFVRGFGFACRRCRFNRCKIDGNIGYVFNACRDFRFLHIVGQVKIVVCKCKRCAENKNRKNE